MPVSKVYRKSIPRHAHSLTSRSYGDMDMGVLVPFFCREIYPADKLKISLSAMFETRALSAPLKNNIKARFYFFFVPYRLMWSNWEKFIFGGKDGDYVAEPPYFWSNRNKILDYKSLWDYLGFPPNSLDGPKVTEYLEKLKVSAFPFCAYQMIWKDWFRNENFSADYWDFENVGSNWLNDGANGASAYGSDPNRVYLADLRRVPWSRNYFTSALPFRQRGSANRVPLSGTAFLHFLQTDGLDRGRATAQDLVAFNGASQTGNAVPLGKTLTQASAESVSSSVNSIQTNPNAEPKFLGINGSDLQGFTITELRLLAKIQEFAEINARFGYRYIEGLRGHFNVSPTDSRLDRPEFIGGSSQYVSVSEILQTSESGATPQGTPTGRGYSFSDGRIGSYFAREHGLVMGVMSIMPEQIYTQGIPREWTRRSKEEFFSPEFNGLSEQEVRVKEVFADPSMSAAELDRVFGYVPAWEELRCGKNMAVGNLRNPDQKDLYAWTQARHFESAPVLGESFIYGDQKNSNGGIRTDAWFTGNAASPFFFSILTRVKKISTVSKSGTPGITRI